MRNIFILLPLLLSSCSLTDIASAVLPSTNKPSIEANVAIGKTNTQDKSLVSVKGEDNRQIADSIANTTTTKADTVNNNNISTLYLILLIMGWLLPAPTEIYREVLRLFKLSK